MAAFQAPEEREIDGEYYSFRRMTAWEQLPLLMRVMRAIRAVNNEDVGFMFMLASMPDEDTRFLLDHCLPTVTRKQGQSWVPICNGSARSMQFDDLEYNVMLQINLVGAVLEVNLQNFTRAAAPSSPNGNLLPG